MGELYNLSPKLPKNVRQIGERDQIVKLYVEDYVNTYLRRLYPTGGEDLRCGLLLGSSEEDNGAPYIFIDGALEMEGVACGEERVDLNDQAWKQAYRDMEEMFPKRNVQGWFLCGAPGSQLSPLNYWKQHSKYFPGKNMIMYLNSGLEGEEALYIASDDGFYKLRGYSIYYERNQMMQDYMIARKDIKRVDAGADDTVIRDFRRKMEERKEEAEERRSTVSVLGGICGALSVAVLAGGIVMFNNYHKMKDMESVLVSVLPAGSEILEDYGLEEPELVLETGTTVLPETLGAGTSGSGDSGGEGKDSLTAGEGGEEGESGETDGAEAEGGSGREEVTGEKGDKSRAAAGPGAEGEESSGELAGEKENQSGKTASSGKEDRPEETEDRPEEMTGDEAEGASDGTSAAGAQKEENETSSDPVRIPSLEEADEQMEAVGEALETASTYVVQPGETLYGICLRRYHDLSRVEEICRLNGLDDVNKIKAGQKLILP